MIKTNRHAYLTCCVATMFLSIAFGASAQTDDSGPVHRPLFDDDSVLTVTIEAPLRTIMRNRNNPEEHPAIFRYTRADGTEATLDILLEIRGKFRAKKETCDFAPLRVNFKKEQVKGTVFAGQDKIKLVTDCQSRKSRFQQILLKEYLAYKILNVLSDRSFSARLLKVTYVDTDKNNQTRESYAFFIEEQNHIADRLGLERIKIPRTKYSALDPAQSNLVNVYEYFIANTDFSLVAGPKGSNCCHNTVLYQKDGGPIINIPYDFDHAGLIDAPYASPNPKFKIKNVKTRVYRGRCANNAQLDATLQLFRDKRDEINQVINGLEGFDDRSLKGTTNFIDRFYEDISTPKDVEKQFIKKCA
jgi:hypothetical protein